MAEFSADQIEDFKEAFGLFDRVGDSQVALNQVADIMRALGQNPTNKDVTKILGSPNADDMANKRINFEAFLPMLKEVDAQPKAPLTTTLRVSASSTRRATAQSWALSCASCCPPWERRCPRTRLKPS
uniref:Myosin light chain 3, skeletal muscle isoform n=1 Tax=Anoplopoma fimbria TaxID=229290 RepID=C3KHS1_ANOFI|nr:Myosin light chain 3, skeletal muscle isoform [Anoplopoma fimbria]